MLDDVALVWCSRDSAPFSRSWPEAGYVLSTPWTQKRKRIDKPRIPEIISNHPVQDLLVGPYGECRYIIGKIPERPTFSGIS